MRAFFVAVLLVFAVTFPAFADHGKTWHWEGDGVRHIEVGSNVPEWLDDDLQMAVDVWNDGLSNVQLHIVQGAGMGPDGDDCPLTDGRIEVCHSERNAGWRGLATYSGHRDGHIDAAQVHLDAEDVHNDEPDCLVNFVWQLIGGCQPPGELEYQQLICHEVGHTLGLNHPEEPDEDSCMSYGSQPTPSEHDFWQVDQLHDHNG